MRRINIKPQYDEFVLPNGRSFAESRLHLPKLGVKLTELTPSQASYIGVKPEGPSRQSSIGTDTLAAVRVNGCSALYEAAALYCLRPCR